MRTVSLERTKGNQYRATRVCIDSYRDGVPVGRLYNPGVGEESSFCSMSQFLLCMEELLDQMRFPQSFSASRAFAPAAPGVSGKSGDEADQPAGSAATFVVRVLFRQNASWQGSVVWEETGREENFRSALELLLMMDGALKEALASGAQA